MLKKGDYLLIVVIILIAAAYFIYSIFLDNNDSDKIAIVKYDGEILQEINLNQVNKPYNITIDKEYKNIILIENGRIRYLESTCKNKNCVNHGWLYNLSDAAACLPNKSSITIKSKNSPELDGVSY